jgi:outer membrane murein-binding lipoprotein Lpp
VAPNALLGFALLGALTLAGCSGSGQQDEAKAAQAQLAALRARTDSLRQHAQAATRHDTAGAQSTLAATTPLGANKPDTSKAQAKPVAIPSADSIARMGDAETAMADSVQKAREIEVLRETFAYAGGTRDPFNSLLTVGKNGPEVADCDLVGVYQDLRTPSNSIVVLREKVSAKRHKLRVGDQLSRARLVQIRPRDAVFMIQDFGFERQETLSLRKQEVETP